jgi:hypothetical protein
MVAGLTNSPINDEGHDGKLSDALIHTRRLIYSLIVLIQLFDRTSVIFFVEVSHCDLFESMSKMISWIQFLLRRRTVQYMEYSSAKV